MGSLRHFIKDVRNASTPTKEREIISKESAKIRTRLRNDQLDVSKRRVYIQKLLYLYVMGEKTYFGQVDCINLIASENYTNKRLGYLSAMLLLKDENPELLTLLTNMISQDLNHKNQYIVSMALCALGSLCNEELARDLCADVINLITNTGKSSPYILKQSLAVASTMIKKDSNLIYQFMSVENGSMITNIYNIYYGSSNKNHSGPVTNGVLLSILEFIRSCLNQQKLKRETDEDIDHLMLQHIVDPLLAPLTNVLKNKNSSSHEPEYEVQGVNDPFLQVSLIQILKLIFVNYGTEVSSQSFSDFKYLLTKIINTSNVTTSSSALKTKNGSSKRSLSVKYEAVKSILELSDIESSLKTLGMNVLLKFLSSKDPNHKYVGLNTLIQGIKFLKELDPKYLQNIFSCLYETDPSIKQRALELVFEIMSHRNLAEPDIVIKELMRFLSQCNETDKVIILYTINKLIELDYFTTTKTGLENLVFCIKYGGKFLSTDQINSLLISINNNSATSSNTSQFLEKLIYLAVTQSNDKVADHYFIYNNYALKLITVWCLGEYGDIILSKYCDETSIIQYLLDVTTEFYDCSTSADSYNIINYLLTTLLKLSIKFQSKSNIERLRVILLNYTKQYENLTIKMKSCQYLVLFEQPTAVKKQFIDHMPLFERTLGSSEAMVTSAEPKSRKTDLLADLLGDMDIKPSPLPSQNVITIPASAKKLYGNQHIEIFANLETPVSDAANSKSIDISVFMRVSPDFASSTEVINGIQFFIAVSKTQKVTLGHLTNNTLSNSINKTVEQRVKIQGTGLLKTRMKVQYEIDSFPYVEQFDETFENVVL